MDGSENGRFHVLTAEPGKRKTREFNRSAGQEKSSDALTMELIEPRTFERECFEVSVRAYEPDTLVETFASVDEWRESARLDENARVALLNIGGRRIADADVRADLTKLIRLAGPTPVIVLAVSEDLGDMLDAVEYGARGYIPASVSMAVMIGATRLAANGGVFLPAPSIFAMREQLKAAADDRTAGGALFTKRQAAVADALRRGKANKLIAYELGMCESTVKVHIRTIMKRLKASNRTEAAFKLHELEDSN
ncbi:response regulator transcription factor [Pikeienuella sp. HZG-20]|uniref:response regulator transcription factor n=1 Tax=Paludibacillus litoralis TaxID=3133267 RepID=UPI0030EEEF4C